MSDLEKRKAKANEEYRDLIDWSILEGKKVIEQLKKEGAVLGLDGHQERFAYIREHTQKRLKEIIAKYNLPSNG